MIGATVHCKGMLAGWLINCTIIQPCQVLRFVLVQWYRFDQNSSELCFASCWFKLIRGSLRFRCGVRLPSGGFPPSTKASWRAYFWGCILGVKFEDLVESHRISIATYLIICWTFGYIEIESSNCYQIILNNGQTYLKIFRILLLLLFIENTVAAKKNASHLLLILGSKNWVFHPTRIFLSFHMGSLTFYFWN